MSKLGMYYLCRIAMGRKKERRFMKIIYLAKGNLNFSIQCSFGLNRRVYLFAVCCQGGMSLCDTSLLYVTWKSFHLNPRICFLSCVHQLSCLLGAERQIFVLGFKNLFMLSEAISS